MDVMQSEHPRWEEFVERTTMAIAGSVTGIDVDAALRGCNGHRLGGALFESAWAVLAYMDMDVERSIEFFEAHGGFCDCEVMLNIAAADDDGRRGHVTMVEETLVSASRSWLWQCPFCLGIYLVTEARCRRCTG